MNVNSGKLRSLGLLVWVALLGHSPVVAAGGGGADTVADGKALFRREFSVGEKSPSRGDGLGPLFNHVSCVACHLQGGVGGAGPIDVNVQLLSAQLSGSRSSTKSILAALRKTHPAFVLLGGEINPNIILHRFGADDRSGLVGKLKYPEFHARVGGLPIPEDVSPADREELIRNLAAQPLPTVVTTPPIRLMRLQRNTTALFGAGLIDQVPNATLKALAEKQREEGEVTGRVPPIGPDKVGRFGWRGQTEHLHDFVLGACSNELGLEVPGNPQPMDPFRPTYRPSGLDLTAAQCASLTEYVAALPPPKFVVPESAERRALVDRGREVFSSLGCAACHVERMGPLDGVYSDLLLHDLGPALADPVMAAATLVLVKQHPPANDLVSGITEFTSSERRQLPQPRTGYYGGSNFSLVGDAPTTVTIVDPKTKMRNEFRAESGPLDREWRTPPLWGLADSAPYLHDGRAATVVEAIVLHGGEAEPSSRRFVALAAADRLSLLEFLSCLKAP